MKTILKLVLFLAAVVTLAGCAQQAPTVPSYAPVGGGYIVPSK